jgi:osmoprotectant transport system permease protein
LTAGTEVRPPDAGEVAVGAPHEGRRTLAGYLFMPVLLAAVLLALYLYVNGQSLDAIEKTRVNADFIADSLRRHIWLTVASTVLVLRIAIPLGVLLTRPALRRLARPLIAVFNIGQALPTIGVLALLAVIWDIGVGPVIVGLFAYTILPVLRNTMVGLEQVDEFVIESARGMGMTKTAVLLKIELPLAVPVIMAGLRTALVINVGTATLATFVNGKGLGDIINAGVVNSRDLMILVGGVLAAVLALLVDYLAGIAEDTLRPRGL